PPVHGPESLGLPGADVPGSGSRFGPGDAPYAGGKFAAGFVGEVAGVAGRIMDDAGQFIAIAFPGALKDGSADIRRFSHFKHFPLLAVFAPDHPDSCPWFKNAGVWPWSIEFAAPTFESHPVRSVVSGAVLYFLFPLLYG